MLGPPKARHVDRPVLVSLEDLVPPGHFYRHLEAALDLAFVRELVRDRYAGIGRPSLDPVIFFKLQLILFFEGLRSERKLVETASLHLAHRWYLGYALDEPLPDHSTLSKIRQRLGVAVFRRFFEHVVELCRAAGLVWGQELFFDATRVRANADVDSVVPRLGRVVGDHLEALFPEGGDASDGPPGAAAGEAAPPPAAVVPLPPRPAPAPPPAPRRAGRQRLVLEPPRWDLLDAGPPRPGAARWPRATGACSAERVSRTDPDATLMRKAGDGPAVLGYQTHYVVDGGRARIILHALTTPGDVRESQPLLDLLWRVRFRWRVRPKHAVGDSKYGTVENIMALEDAGIRAYFPLADTDAPRRAPTTPWPPSRTTPSGTSTAAPRASPCGATGSPGRRSSSATSPTPRSATPARSRPPARRGRPAATSTARSTRRTSTGCGPTTRPSPTRRRCASGRSGSSRCSGRPSSGTACGSSASAAWRR